MNNQTATETLDAVFGDTKFRKLSELGIANCSETAMAHPAPQGSIAWDNARLGVVSGTFMKSVVTPLGAARSGKGADSARRRLVADLVYGVPRDIFPTAAMDEGSDGEPHARKWYEGALGVKAVETGFIYADDRKMWGVSPDGITTEGVYNEIKCLQRDGHMAIVESEAVPGEHIPQCQYGMWVTGAKFCDFIAWSPISHCPNVCIRIEPDPVFVATFEEIVPTLAERTILEAAGIKACKDIIVGVQS